MTEKRRVPDSKTNRLVVVERIKLKRGSVVGWNREAKPNSVQNAYFVVERVTPGGYLMGRPSEFPKGSVFPIRMSPVHVDKLPRTVLKAKK